MAEYRFYVNHNECVTTENKPLLRYLRDDLRLYSAKDGCSEGACGTCTVVVDGVAVKACVLTTEKAAGRHILTVEGLSVREKEAFVYAFGSKGSVQCGFCIPGMVMAGKALIDRNPDPTDEEIKKAIRGNVCRCTGYRKIIEGISEAAAILRGDREIDDLEAGRDYGVGSRAFRVDVRRKTLGYGKYPDDIGPEYFVPEGSEPDFINPDSANDAGVRQYVTVDPSMPPMAYASAVRSKYPRARVLKIDAEKAKALPGVLGVLTAADVPHNKVGHIQQDWDVMIAEGDITRSVGDAICLVAAESPYILAKAKALVKIEYEELQPVRSIEEAKAPGAPLLHEHAPGNLCQSRHVVRGDAKKALAESKYVVTEHFKTPFTEHAFLEPECAVAFPYKNGVKILSTDQGAYDTRHETLIMFGWEDTPERVVVENQLIGGGFGGKEDVSVQHLAALCAVKYGRPFKVKLTRQESLAFHPKRHAMEGTFTLGCDENGILTGLDCEINFDTGAYASLCGPVLERACTHSVGPYCYHNTDIRGFGYYTNNPPAGAFRGFGVCQSEFALESLLNILAEKVGISPWEIRYRNAIEPGKTLPNGQIADVSTALKETLLAVKPYFDANPGRAGIACAMKNAGVGVGLPDKGRCRLIVRDGVVEIYSAASDIGQGCLTVFCQDVAEATGLPLGCIRNGIASTENAPDSGTTSGSRQTLLTGEAVRGAAFLLRDAMTAAMHCGADQDMIRKLIVEGANLRTESLNSEAEYGTGTEDAPGAGGGEYVSRRVVIEADGTISGSGSGLNQGTYGEKGTQTAIRGIQGADPAELIKCLEGMVFSYEYFEPTDKITAFHKEHPKSHIAYGYATNVVLIDDDGRVTDVYAAYDAGKVVNPISIQGQIEGGVLMGLGYALTEDFPLKDCVPQAKYGTLGLMRAPQIPEIHAMYVEKEELLGVAYGAKGVGEITTIPAAPAVQGAYYARDHILRSELPMKDTFYSKKA
ncbi:MAG: molybdopterin-dependent oxidoreductase [Lachnospiraceae bacterium]|nr:molybdopterin-dependent oxidoreductase [Lachnospiraceae bacterium]